MNAAIRAHRILRDLANYQKAGHANEWISKLADDHLGEPVGCYRNPGAQNEVIGIFADGLAWSQNGRAVDLRFTDIAEVTLPREKESLELLLKLMDGRQLQLPVRGQQGKFFDSLTMLRFLMRVTEDLRRPFPRSKTEPA